MTNGDNLYSHPASAKAFDEGFLYGQAKARRMQGYHKPGGVTPMEPPPSEPINAVIIVVILFAIMLIGLAFFAGRATATEYLQINQTHIVYCDLYAKRSSHTVAGIVQAYGDCIRVLPERLPMPIEQGTVPATGETWAEACDREYRTWDATTGTVVRKGSPDRVECPLVLREGVWVLPE